MVTVSGPVTWVEAMFWKAGPVRMEACCFSRLSWRAAAFRGVPSWKLMPDRSVMVKTV
jgi:hypothetical protein